MITVSLQNQALRLFFISVPDTDTQWPLVILLLASLLPEHRWQMHRHREGSWGSRCLLAVSILEAVMPVGTLTSSHTSRAPQPLGEWSYLHQNRRQIGLRWKQTRFSGFCLPRGNWENRFRDICLTATRRPLRELEEISLSPHSLLLHAQGCHCCQTGLWSSPKKNS